MPQTREHLDICELLGLRGGVVALSKCDLAPGELRELARLELREALAGTFLRDAPIIPCSARTGEGLAELTAALQTTFLRLSRFSRDADGLCRLPVDRVFAMRGFGTVATGTLFSGRLRVGDELAPLPGPGGRAAPAKVRGLQVHGQPVDEAVAGQRVAVNLAALRESMARGDTLVSPDSLAPTLLLDVKLRYLPVAREPLPRRSQLLFHSAGAQRLCGVTLLDAESLRPGQSGFAQLQLDEPLVLLPGDRFVLRGFSPQENHGTTVGGGLVLRTQCRRQRRGSPELLATLGQYETALTTLRNAEDAATAVARLVALEVGRCGPAGATLHTLRQSIPAGEAPLRAALRALCEPGRRSDAQRGVVGLVALLEKTAEPGAAAEEPLYVSRESVAAVRDALLQALAEHHRKEPRALGLPRETLRIKTTAALHAALPPRLYQHVLDALLQEGAVAAEKELLRLSAHKVTSDEGEKLLAARIESLYRDAGLAPPRLDELAALLNAGPDKAEPPRPAAISAAVETLLRSGTLLRIKDLIFLRAHVDELRGRLVAYLRAHREITAQAFKDLVGQSRKFSIPLAEYFDAEKVTLRVGDLRRLRG
jgi:selenocysteine-specific elongation factor